VQGGEVKVGTEMTLTAGEKVRQEAGARVTVGGLATLEAGTDVELGNAGNDFARIRVTGGRDVTLGDANAVTLAGADVKGALGVGAGGTVGQEAPLSVTGTTRVTAKDGTGAAQDVELGDFNDFAGAVSVEGRHVTVNDVNGLKLGDLDAKGNLVVGSGGVLEREAGTVLSVDGTTRLEARDGNGVAQDIRLGEFNRFGGRLEIAAARDAQVESAGALELGTTRVEGNLGLLTDGKVSQGAGTTVSVGGTTELSAYDGPGKAADVELGEAGNDFGTVKVTSARDVTLADANGIELGASTVGGNLKVSAKGAVSDGGAVVVKGTTTVGAGAGNDVTLDNAGNNFASVAVTSARNVTLVDADGIELGASRVGGELRVTAHGAITDGGALVVGGTTTLEAGAENNVLLDELENDFATVSVTGATGGAGGPGVAGGNNRQTLTDADAERVGFEDAPGGGTVFSFDLPEAPVAQ